MSEQRYLVYFSQTTNCLLESFEYYTGQVCNNIYFKVVDGFYIPGSIVIPFDSVNGTDPSTETAIAILYEQYKDIPDDIIYMGCISLYT